MGQNTHDMMKRHKTTHNGTVLVVPKNTPPSLLCCHRHHCRHCHRHHHHHHHHHHQGTHSLSHSRTHSQMVVEGTDISALARARAGAAAVVVVVMVYLRAHFIFKLCFNLCIKTRTVTKLNNRSPIHLITVTIYPSQSHA